MKRGTGGVKRLNMYGGVAGKVDTREKKVRESVTDVDARLRLTAVYWI